MYDRTTSSGTFGRARHRHLAEAGAWPGIGADNDVHDLLRVIDRGGELERARQRMRLRPVEIDDARLRRTDIGGARWIAGFEPDDPLRHRHSLRGLRQRHISQTKKRTQFGLHLNRHEGTVAPRFRGLDEAGSGLLRHINHGIADADAQDGVVIALGPECIEERGEVGRRTACQHITIRRSVLAQLVKV